MASTPDFSSPGRLPGGMAPREVVGLVGAARVHVAVRWARGYTGSRKGLLRHRQAVWPVLQAFLKRCGVPTATPPVLL